MKPDGFDYGGDDGVLVIGGGMMGDVMGEGVLEELRGGRDVGGGGAGAGEATVD